jgi:NADH:ubiquinone oxidoreductase subunit 6 (subunit J)
MTASELDSISEAVFPKNVESYWSIFCWLEAGAILVSIPIAWVVANPSLWDALLYTLIGGLALSPLCLIFAGTQTDYLHRQFGNVHLDDETISVFDRTHGCDYTAKLADCRWFIGSRTWATVPFHGSSFGWGSAEALLIVFPDAIRTPEHCAGKAEYAEGPAIVAVGLTSETRLQWEQVLWRMGIEKDVHRESLSPSFSQEFLIFWGIFILAASWSLGLGMGRTVDDLLIRWSVPADIAQGIAFSLFVPGTIWLAMLLWFVPMLCWTEHQYERGRDRDIVMGICVFTVILIAVCWSMVGNGNNDWTARSALAATLVNTVMAIGMALVVWRLLAEPRNEEEVQSQPEGCAKTKTLTEPQS